ncbi:MAG: serine O-acetyltransferase [Muribaculaceae bacterium]|nr:serine O-acetyltransferase [Muribaculaceae bacterium]
MKDSILQIIDREVKLLRKDNPTASASIPMRHKVQEMMDQIWDTIFFTNFHPFHHEGDAIRLGILAIFNELTLQLEILNESFGNGQIEARNIAKIFISKLHEIKEKMLTDVEAVITKDPAAACPLEVIASYPSIKAILYYRIARVLIELEVPILPRMITELAHASTGIDIHPGAKIGNYFAIDHGTGVVIGETAVIGNHVTLYQGVTLGAKAFTYDEDGVALPVPRHPIIEDNVTIYSNASVLGRITVGHDSVIGGNIWLTHSVEPYSKVTQSSSVTQPTAKY